MAVSALAIDIMLPAFGEMRTEFGLAANSNALAPVITFFLIGLAVGQPIWGPLSDSIGRRSSSMTSSTWTRGFPSSLACRPRCSGWACFSTHACSASSPFGPSCEACSGRTSLLP
ncbi:MAG: MFS transporter [Acidimicrobiia bacterium]